MGVTNGLHEGWEKIRPTADVQADLSKWQASPNPYGPMKETIEEAVRKAIATNRHLAGLLPIVVDPAMPPGEFRLDPQPYKPDHYVMAATAYDALRRATAETAVEDRLKDAPAPMRALYSSWVALGQQLFDPDPETNPMMREEFWKDGNPHAQVFRAVAAQIVSRQPQPVGELEKQVHANIFSKASEAEKQDAIELAKRAAKFRAKLKAKAPPVPMPTVAEEMERLYGQEMRPACGDNDQNLTRQQEIAREMSERMGLPPDVFDVRLKNPPGPPAPVAMAWGNRPEGVPCCDECRLTPAAGFTDGHKFVCQFCFKKKRGSL